MTNRLPPTPYGSDWQTWALQLVEYLNDAGRDTEVIPKVVQLQHMTLPRMEKAVTEGILMYDPVSQAPVISINKVWVNIITGLPI